MDLLTVTCFHDKLPMLLQAESIQKFVSPCTHWVVINDNVHSIDEWYCLLKPYYQNHTLKVIPAPFINEYVSNSAGWVSQQVYKLYAYKLIKEDYLVLDSKNFFIKPCSTSDWSDVIGSGVIEGYRDNSGWALAVDAYSKHFNLPTDYIQLAVLTPFVFKKEIFEQVEDFDQFLLDFINIDTIKSEFLMYSLLLRKLGVFPTVDLTHIKHRKYNTITKKYRKIKIEQYIDYMFSSENIKVAGLHRHFLNVMSKDDKVGIIKWLRNLGFKNLPFE